MSGLQAKLASPWPQRPVGPKGRGIVLDVYKVTSKHPHRPWQHLIHCSGSLEPEYSCHDRDWIMELPMEADILIFTGILTPEDASVASCCSGSLEPEYSCHDRDWIMELPMEADILTFTGILTPEDGSVASCFPFDIRGASPSRPCGTNQTSPYKN